MNINEHNFQDETPITDATKHKKKIIMMNIHTNNAYHKRPKLFLIGNLCF